MDRLMVRDLIESWIRLYDYRYEFDEYDKFVINIWFYNQPDKTLRILISDDHIEYVLKYNQKTEEFTTDELFDIVNHLEDRHS